MSFEHNNHKQTSKKSPIQQHLEQEFDQFGEAIQAPDDLKKEVFNTLDTLALLGDIADLFTAKFAGSEANLLDFILPEEGITDSAKK